MEMLEKLTTLLIIFGNSRRGSDERNGPVATPDDDGADTAACHTGERDWYANEWMTIQKLPSKWLNKYCVGGLNSAKQSSSDDSKWGVLAAIIKHGLMKRAAL